jgi:hypothetical protein
VSLFQTRSRVGARDLSNTKFVESPADIWRLGREILWPNDENTKPIWKKVNWGIKPEKRRRTRAARGGTRQKPYGGGTVLVHKRQPRLFSRTSFLHLHHTSNCAIRSDQSLPMLWSLGNTGMCLNQPLSSCQQTTAMQQSWGKYSTGVTCQPCNERSRA